jgi:hypothetical protein
MAHAHDLGNGSHGQALAVGGSDGLVPLCLELIAGLLQRRLTPGVALGKGRQAASGLGGLAFSAGDLPIV